MDWNLSRSSTRTAGPLALIARSTFHALPTSSYIAFETQFQQGLYLDPKLELSSDLGQI